MAWYLGDEATEPIRIDIKGAIPRMQLPENLMCVNSRWLITLNRDAVRLWDLTLLPSSAVEKSKQSEKIEWGRESDKPRDKPRHTRFSGHLVAVEH